MNNRPVFLNTKAPVMAMVIAGVIAIKWCFADANAAQLDWLLRPASQLVTFISGLNFTHIESQGYYNATEDVLIAPACSGLNFFLILLTTGWCLAIRCPPPISPGWWFLGIAAAAYAFSLAINTCRILMAIYLYRWQIAWGEFSPLFSPERLHRLEGVLIYYFCLCLFAVLLSKLLQKCRQRAPDLSPPSRPPYGWIVAGLYLLFTLGIPLVNGAAVKTALFIEHGLTVLVLVTGLALAVKVWNNRRSSAYRFPLNK